MRKPPVGTEILAFHAMPEVAAALRARKEAILARWLDYIQRVLPDAEALTRNQVRDTIPFVLNKLIDALEAGEHGPTDELVDTAQYHGKTRYFEQYNLEELITEYRLLRHIILDEISTALGGQLTTPQVAALSAGIDIAFQQGVLHFVRELAGTLRSAAEAELKFLSYLSHDLRNDLNAFVLNLQMVAERIATAPEFHDEAEELRTMQQGVMNTIHGMERLLQAERLRKQTTKPQSRTANLNMLAVEVVSQFARVAEDKGLTAEILIPPDAELTTDPDILRLVLQNLLGNAVKYTMKGRIQIKATPPAEDHGWILSVHDQGPGISEEHQKHIFDAFIRGDTLGQPGIGLGLTIAAQGARLLGAELTVSSKLGEGSTFSIRFPP